MGKIKFGGVDLLGRPTKGAYPTRKEFILLSYFLEDIEYSTAEIIGLLEKLYSKKITFEDIENEYSWDIGSGSGTFSCDAETAYFTSDVKSLESTEIPLKELIEILYAWKDFLGE